MTLTDFLLARIAEDEAEARAGGADAMTGVFWKQLEPDAYDEIQTLALKYARRVTAECEAKRRIVEQAKPMHLHDGPSDWWFVRELASVYADHPDYRDEWRP